MISGQKGKPMTTASLSSQPSFLNKKLFLGVTTATLLLIAIMVISIVLHMYNIDSIGGADAY